MVLARLDAVMSSRYRSPTYVMFCPLIRSILPLLYMMISVSVLLSKPMQQIPVEWSPDDSPHRLSFSVCLFTE